MHVTRTLIGPNCFTGLHKSHARVVSTANPAKPKNQLHHGFALSDLDDGKGHTNYISSFGIEPVTYVRDGLRILQGAVGLALFRFLAIHGNGNV